MTWWGTYRSMMIGHARNTDDALQSRPGCQHHVDRVSAVAHRKPLDERTAYVQHTAQETNKIRCRPVQRSAIHRPRNACDLHSSTGQEHHPPFILSSRAAGWEQPASVSLAALHPAGEGAGCGLWAGRQKAQPLQTAGTREPAVAMMMTRCAAAAGLAGRAP